MLNLRRQLTKFPYVIFEIYRTNLICEVCGFLTHFFLKDFLDIKNMYCQSSNFVKIEVLLFPWGDVTILRNFQQAGVGPC